MKKAPKNREHERPIEPVAPEMFATYIDFIRPDRRGWSGCRWFLRQRRFWGDLRLGICYDGP